MAGDPERVGGSARKLGRCQEGTSPELLVAIAHNSTRECVCVHSFSFLSPLLFFYPINSSAQHKYLQKRPVGSRELNTSQEALCWR